MNVQLKKFPVFLKSLSQMTI